MDSNHNKKALTSSTISGRVTKAKTRLTSKKNSRLAITSSRSKVSGRSRSLRTPSDRSSSDSEAEHFSTTSSGSSHVSSLPHVLQYVEGDATTPIGTGKKIIAHICNTAGGWGRGFVLALSKRWHLPEEQYRTLPTPIDLGLVQFVSVTEDITVANMIGQTAPNRSGDPPIKYAGLRIALRKVATKALEMDATVHMPRIGAGLSRGNWDRISEIIKEELVHLEIPTFIYVLE